MPTPIPTTIKLHKTSRTLELGYADGRSFSLPAEYLRVSSPSAEVRGHGKPVLQTGKQHVALVGIEPAGSYALKLVFDDGHDSGLFTWEYLYQLATEQPQRWQAYLDQLAAAGASRDPHTSAVRFIP
ncbi:MAG: 1-(5-phosphoribosyl)-5-((5-phosphoribosylamino)methylideneamino)imidazole-4-carboxamide isomerase [Gammaproteobacteria bacterium HGW-Gammaproteobacteria-6]|nr:MAG: 1-(5-phosphoribosyl)-5-((5-phosphoribosylamino)methylideneamino)imidazole-4-carboxamide isomerase [Gammaproteobacteria bacterium HGW-Gammaproteobacteria-6]